MTDRERVIKGLECCASMNDSACRECPYSSECVAGETTYQTGIAHLTADALALLKDPDHIKVVRCMDCRHWQPNNAEEGDNSGYCRNRAECENQLTDATFFCGSAERGE